jgi:hypothetical protein
MGDLHCASSKVIAVSLIFLLGRSTKRRTIALKLNHLESEIDRRLHTQTLTTPTTKMSAPKTPETLQPSLPTTSQRVWTMIPTLFYYLLAYMILMTIFNFLVHAIYIVIEFYRTMDMDSLLLEVAFGWTMIATSAILLVAAFHIWMLAQTLDGGNPQVPAWILALIAMVGEEV